MRYIKKLFFFLITAVVFPGCYCAAQVKPLPVEKADSVMQDTAKPLLILLYTDWCKYCQMQKSQLRKNKEFIKRGDRFYYIELNAEGREKIHFNGKNYAFRAKGAATGIHELAAALNGSENVSFPTWILLSKDYEVLFRYSGILVPGQLKLLLSFIDGMSKKYPGNDAVL